MDKLKQAIQERLTTVYDPELGINIVDLGLVYECILEEENRVYIKMTLTTPGCPLHDTIVEGVKSALKGIPDISDVKVDVVWDPPWSPANMSDEAKEQLGFM